jgi:hypothetical protein
VKKTILLLIFFLITILNADGVTKENNHTKDKNFSSILGDTPSIDDIYSDQSQAPTNHNLILPSIAPISTTNISSKKVENAKIKYEVTKFNVNIASLEAKQRYVKIQLDHIEENNKIMENTYHQQQITTSWIFYLIAFMTLTGLGLSYMQFKKDTDSNHSTFKLNKEGLEFSSSVVGVIVLFISFFFFYIYVKDVYAISTNTEQNKSKFQVNLPK